MEDFSLINDLKKCLNHKESDQILQNLFDHNIHRLIQLSMENDEIDLVWK